MQSFFIIITVYVSMSSTYGFSYGSKELTHKWKTREQCEQAMLKISYLPKGDKLVKSVDGNNAIIFTKDGKAFGAAHCLEIKN